MKIKRELQEIHVVGPNGGTLNRVLVEAFDHRERSEREKAARARAQQLQAGWLTNAPDLVTSAKLVDIY